MQMTTTVPTATIPPITPPAIAPALLPPLSLSPVLDSVGGVVTITFVTAVDDNIVVIVIDSDDSNAVDNDSDIVIAVVCDGDIATIDFDVDTVVDVDDNCAGIDNPVDDDDDDNTVIAVDVDENVAVMCPPKHVQR